MPWRASRSLSRKCLWALRRPEAVKQLACTQGLCQVSVPAGGEAGVFRGYPSRVSPRPPSLAWQPHSSSLDKTWQQALQRSLVLWVPPSFMCPGPSSLRGHRSHRPFSWPALWAPSSALGGGWPCFCTGGGRAATEAPAQQPSGSARLQRLLYASD